MTELIEVRIAVGGCAQGKQHHKQQQPGLRSKPKP
jgi:hypothetical protein